MALDSTGRSTLYQVVSWARLPIQVPLVWWAVAVARQAGQDQARETK